LLNTCSALFTKIDIFSRGQEILRGAAPLPLTESQEAGKINQEAELIKEKRWFSKRRGLW